MIWHINMSLCVVFLESGDELYVLFYVHGGLVHMLQSSLNVLLRWLLVAQWPLSLTFLRARL